MPFAALAPILSGVSGIAGALANKKKTTTSTTTPTLDPAFGDLQGDLMKRLRERMANPGGGEFAKIKAGAMTGVNRSAADSGRALNSRLAAKGFGGAGSDGRSGRAQVDLEVGRDRAIGDMETKFSSMLLDREDSSMGLAERMLSMGRGTSSSSTAPGNALAGGLDSGISTLTTLTMLDKLMRPAASGGGGTTNDFMNWTPPPAVNTSLKR